MKHGISFVKRPQLISFDLHAGPTPAGGRSDRAKRTVKVIVETERTFIFRSRGDRQAAWCAGCGAEVEMATVKEVARAAGVSELTICRRIEACALHFAETADGRVFICIDSLQK